MRYRSTIRITSAPEPFGAATSTIVAMLAPGRDGSAFVRKAIENNVLIIPGGVFSERDTHFRISYATDDDKIRRGCETLCEMARHPHTVS